MSGWGAWAWPAGLAGLGLVIGSFAATVALRWPEGRSVAAGRSRCDDCARVLGPAELVPLLSYAVQGGRCRGCDEPIASLHPAMELGGLAVGLAAGLAAPGWPGAAGALFGWLLLTLAAIDLRAFWLPDRLTAALAVLGLAIAATRGTLAEAAIGGAAGVAALWLVATGYRQLRGRVGLGGGDPKLLGAIGCWLGWRSLPAVVLAACLLGLVALAGWRSTGRPLRADMRLPFGALLAPAAFGVWLATGGAGA
jgi:leader peptidase (prepilin peptidase) / N-methyltransferase